MARVAAGALIGIAEGNPEWRDVPAKEKCDELKTRRRAINDFNQITTHFAVKGSTH
jgi:hypothetical protein